MLRKVICGRWPRALLVSVACMAFLLGTLAAARWRFYGVGLTLMLLPILLLTLRRHGLIAVVILVAFCGCLGLLRGTQYADKRIVYDDLNQQKVTLTGRVDSDAVYGKGSQLTFDMRDARVPAPYDADLVGGLQVSGFGEPMLYKGDIIRVSGKLYKSRGNAQARISYAQLELLERHPSAIDKLRREFAAGIQSAVPEPAASFGMGLLIGQRNTLPEETSEQLKHVGLTHIIAVSGYNLTIILRSVGRLLQKRSKFQFVVASAGLVMLFLLLTGFSPSIVRASVVCGLGLVAWYYGRSVNPFALLLTAAAITVAANPLYIWGNVSWMLSFLAFFGVLVLAPVATKRFCKKHPPGLIKAMVIETLCAEAATLPYVLYIFGEFSAVSLLANVLVAAFVPLAMLTSLIAGLAGMLIPAVAGWLAWPATLVMTYMLDMAQWLSSWPKAFIGNIEFSATMLVTGYLITIFVTWVAWRKGLQNVIITDKENENTKEQANVRTFQMVNH